MIKIFKLKTTSLTLNKKQEMTYKNINSIKNFIKDALNYWDTKLLPPPLSFCFVKIDNCCTGFSFISSNPLLALH
jgi:hypothetical protein